HWVPPSPRQCHFPPTCVLREPRLIGRIQQRNRLHSSIRRGTSFAPTRNPHLSILILSSHRWFFFCTFIQVSRGSYSSWTLHCFLDLVPFFHRSSGPGIH
ncbi:hypothetical protein NDU88_000949, partial [Pleurodeles waltl]